MTLDLAAIISRTFEISWRHKWLWLLGVFGGGGAGFGGLRAFPMGGGRRAPGQAAATMAQFQSFISDNAWILAVVAGGFLVIAVVVLLFSCVAVPGSIWAALNLDAGRQVGAGQAWRYGLRRFGPFLRLYVLRLLIGLVLLTPVGIAVALIVASVGHGGGALAVSILLLVLVIFVFVVATLLVSVALVWAERLIVIGNLGAIAAMRQSWWLVRRSLVDTVLFAVVLGLLAGVIGIGVTVVSALVALPGIVLAIAGFSSGGVLFIAGAAWVVVAGLGALLLGGGFVGSLVQVAYALACRDLCRRHGLEIAPDLAAAPGPSPAAQPAPAT